RGSRWSAAQLAASSSASASKARRGRQRRAAAPPSSRLTVVHDSRARRAPQAPRAAPERWGRMGSVTSGRRTIRTMCPMNCHPTLCGMLVEVEDGRLVGVRGDPENPDSRGFLCVRGHAAKEIIGNPQRLLHPLRRSPRSGTWQRTTWADALDTIAERARAVGPRAVGAWSGHGFFANDYGTRLSSELLRRFANLYGCQWWNPNLIRGGL